MIVPISIACSERMNPIRQQIYANFYSAWMSHFAIRPQPLFAEIMQRNTVLIGRVGETQNRIFSTNYLRWTASERDNLFFKLFFKDVSPLVEFNGVIPKISSEQEFEIVQILRRTSKTIASLGVNRSILLYFHDSGESYWTKALLEKPIAYRNGKVVDPSQWFAIGLPKDSLDLVYLL
jgi:hypothetical protein